MQGVRSWKGLSSHFYSPSSSCPACLHSQSFRRPPITRRLALELDLHDRGPLGADLQLLNTGNQEAEEVRPISKKQKTPLLHGSCINPADYATRQAAYATVEACESEDAPQEVSMPQYHSHQIKRTSIMQGTTQAAYVWAWIQTLQWPEAATAQDQGATWFELYMNFYLCTGQTLPVAQAPAAKTKHREQE